MTPPLPPGFRLTILVSWREEGCWDLVRRLRQAGLKVTVRHPWLPRWSPRLSRISGWLSRHAVPLWMRLHPAGAQAVVSWNVPYAVVYGLLRRLPGGQRHAPLHLARDFHIDPSRFDEPGYALKLRLLGWAMPGIDRALTTSRAEARCYPRLLGRPPEQFRFLPDEPASELFDRAPEPCAGHVFAYGNSDRDFDTVLRAAAMVDARFMILSQTEAPRRPLPPNVTWLRHFLSREELLHLVATAACCLVPLRDARVAAGQNAMFEALALARPLVIARNVATVEYVEDGVNGRLYQPGDADDLAAALRRCLASPAEAAVMAARGRRTAWDCLDREAEILLETLGECLEEKRKKRKMPPAAGRA